MYKKILLPALTFFLFISQATASERLALLIGNQTYSDSIGELNNPHNDIKNLSAALKKLGFNVRTVKDASFGTFHKEIKKYTSRLKRAGDNAIGFFYYSGHGAADGNNRNNYLIPTDVEHADTSELWDNSIRVSSILNEMKERASNATHFIVLDACRNTLKLSRPGTKSLTKAKGFRPVRKMQGMLIAYATAQGEVAYDGKKQIGPYARELLNQINKPGVEAVSMFRSVQLAVRSKIKQEPWLSYGALPEIYFGGRYSPAEIMWNKIKSGNDIRAYRTFIKKYPRHSLSEFAKLRVRELKRQAEAIKHQEAKESWEKIKNSANQNDYKKFLNDHPDSIFTSLATEKLGLIARGHKTENNTEEKSASRVWQSINRNSPQHLKAFIEQFPGTPFSEIARLKLQQLEERQKKREEYKAWNSIKDTQNKEVLMQYIEKFPTSIFANFASERIRELGRKNAPVTEKQDNPDTEEAAQVWKTIEKTNSIAILTSFKSKFPASIYAKLATARIKELQRIQQSATGSVGSKAYPFDGRWRITKLCSNIRVGNKSFHIVVRKGRITNRVGAKGSISKSGNLSFRSGFGGYFTGKVKGKTGSGYVNKCPIRYDKVG